MYAITKTGDLQKNEETIKKECILNPTLILHTLKLLYLTHCATDLETWFLIQMTRQFRSAVTDLRIACQGAALVTAGQMLPRQRPSSRREARSGKEADCSVSVPQRMRPVPLKRGEWNFIHFRSRVKVGIKRGEVGTSARQWKEGTRPSVPPAWSAVSHLTTRCI